MEGFDPRTVLPVNWFRGRGTVPYSHERSFFFALNIAFCSKAALFIVIQENIHLAFNCTRVPFGHHVCRSKSPFFQNPAVYGTSGDNGFTQIAMIVLSAPHTFSIKLTGCNHKDAYPEKSLVSPKGAKQVKMSAHRWPHFTKHCKMSMLPLSATRKQPVGCAEILLLNLYLQSHAPRSKN